MRADEREPERNAMIDQQLRARGIVDGRVLAAMAEVPRHAFVPQAVERSAYQDSALPIGSGQTISQPLIVALMAQALALQPHEHVLEVGTGSGYAAAVLSRLARMVYSIERHQPLAQESVDRLAWLGYQNVQVVLGDGSNGLPAHAPYPAIVVAAAAPDIPRPLIEQLADGGRLVLPLGSLDEQWLVRVVRRGDQISQERLGGVRFVPLIGEWGWHEDPPRQLEA